MFPFGFCSINVGQGLGKYDFDLAVPRRIERASDNGGVSLDQVQVVLYYLANIILLRCFYSLFPCQIWPSISPWFVSCREHSFWITFCTGLCSCSRNGHARILAGHSSGCVNGVGKPLPHSDPQWDFSGTRHLCVTGMTLGEENGAIEILFQ